MDNIKFLLDELESEILEYAEVVYRNHVIQSDQMSDQKYWVNVYKDGHELESFKGETRKVALLKAVHFINKQ